MASDLTQKGEAVSSICRALELADELRTVVIRRSYEFSYYMFKQKFKEIIYEIGVN